MGTPFLHATTSIAKLKAIYSERRDRYPGGIAVRFLRSKVKCLDVGFQTKDNKAVFGEQPEDDLNVRLQEDLQALRSYGSKDSEVVCLSNPPPKDVEFWHNIHGCWFPTTRWVGSTVVSNQTHAR